MRTDIMRAFPFPSIPGEQFMPQSLVWNRIARNYLTRFVNEAYRIYYPPKEGLSSREPRIRNPQGMILYYRELAEAKGTLRQIDLWRAWVNLVRYGLHAGEDITDQFRTASSKARWLAGLGPGIVLHCWDRCRLRLKNRHGDRVA